MAIIPMLIMFIVTTVETIGNLSGIAEGGLGREVSDKELSGGVVCDGMGSTAGILSKLPAWISTLFGESGVVTAAIVAIVLNLIIPKEKV